MEPLAFGIGPEIFKFLFTVEGRYSYHVWSECGTGVYQFKGPFDSHDDFLARLDDDSEWDTAKEIQPICSEDESSGDKEDKERGYIILDQDPTDGSFDALIPTS